MVAAGPAVLSLVLSFGIASDAPSPSRAKPHAIQVTAVARPPRSLSVFMAEWAYLGLFLTWGEGLHKGRR